MFLSIDTCGATGSLALGRWEGDAMAILAEAELAGRTFAALLTPRIRELLSAQAAAPGDLATIVVVNGPGSFTGVRIGVSAAKGLAEALSIPVIAVSRLALLARQGSVQAAALDAGRGEFYFGRYADGDHIEKLLTAAAMAEYASEPIAVCEAGLENLWTGSVKVEAPNAADALLAAAARIRAKDYDDLAALDGNYVRRTDAELFARPAPVRT